MMHDVHARLVSHVGQMGVVASQEIPDWHMQSLADAREDSNRPSREYHRVASIPAVLVDTWLRQGFDVYRESARAIVARLQREDLNAFVTTNKRI